MRSVFVPSLRTIDNRFLRTSLYCTAKSGFGLTMTDLLNPSEKYLLLIPGHKGSAFYTNVATVAIGAFAPKVVYVASAAAP